MPIALAESHEPPPAPCTIEAHPTRPFDIVRTEQRSREWFDARLGRVTGSVAGAVWDTKRDGKPTAEWKKLQDRLLAELLTGLRSEDTFTSLAMQRGIDLEPVAREALARRMAARIDEAGFLAHRKLRIGSSLDGYVGDFEVVAEIKCPATTTHLQYIETRELPDGYMGQLLHNLYVSGADRLWFASYDNRMPPSLQLLVIERKAADLPIAEYAARLDVFLTELAQRHLSLAAAKALPVF